MITSKINPSMMNLSIRYVSAHFRLRVPTPSLPSKRRERRRRLIWEINYLYFLLLMISGSLTVMDMENLLLGKNGLSVFFKVKKNEC